MHVSFQARTKIRRGRADALVKHSCELVLHVFSLIFVYLGFRGGSHAIQKMKQFRHNVSFYCDWFIISEAVKCDRFVP